MRIPVFVTLLAAVFGIAGCSKGDPDLPSLHPVNGVVTMNGKQVDKGSLMVRAETDNPKVVVVANLAPDGKFDLSTILVSDSSGKKHPGAPAGTYKLTYAIPSDEQIAPIELKDKYSVETGQTNQWTVELSEKNEPFRTLNKSLENAS